MITNASIMPRSKQHSMMAMADESTDVELMLNY
jgi:hypothetical protein